MEAAQACTNPGCAAPRLLITPLRRTPSELARRGVCGLLPVVWQCCGGPDHGGLQQRAVTGLRVGDAASLLLLLLLLLLLRAPSPASLVVLHRGCMPRSVGAAAGGVHQCAAYCAVALRRGAHTTYLPAHHGHAGLSPLRMRSLCSGCSRLGPCTRCVCTVIPEGRGLVKKPCMDGCDVPTC